MYRFMISPLARVYAWELARHAEQLPLGQNKCFLGALCIVEGKPGPEGLHYNRNLQFSPKNFKAFVPFESLKIWFKIHKTFTQFLFFNTQKQWMTIISIFDNI